MQASIARRAPGPRRRRFAATAEGGELELIVGARRPAVRPQVVVGAGGVLVELLKDVAALPAPVDAASARRAVEGLKIAPLLGAYRGRGAGCGRCRWTSSCAWAGWRTSWPQQRGADFEIEVNPLKLRQQGARGCGSRRPARIGRT